MGIGEIIAIVLFVALLGFMLYIAFTIEFPDSFFD